MDATEVLPDEVPADLYDKVEKNRAWISEIRLQAMRRGKWILLRNRLNFTPPMDADVQWVCEQILGWARTDSENHANGEAERYRAKITIQVASDRPPQHRYAMLRTYVDDDGALSLKDDHSSVDERGLMAQIAQDRRQEQDFYFRALDAMTRQIESQAKQAEGFADVSEAFRVMLLGVAEVTKNNAAGEAERMRIILEGQIAQYEHEESVEKIRGLTEVLKKPAEKAAAEFAVWLRKKANEPKAKPKAEGKASNEDPNLSPFARKLARIFNDMTPAQTQATLELFTSDERDCIDNARKARDDRAFSALFHRFYGEIKKRGEDGVNELLSKLQDTMPAGCFISLFELMQDADGQAA